jgi:hypothetical protein
MQRQDGRVDWVGVGYGVMLTTIVVVMAFLAGIAWASGVGRCPTEDSCRATYDHGSWTVTQTSE